MSSSRSRATDAVAQVGDALALTVSTSLMMRRGPVRNSESVTRFAIDAAVALQVTRDEVRLREEHQLAAPNLLRSEALPLPIRGVRDCELDET
jgi:hypothetical protein